MGRISAKSMRGYIVDGLLFFVGSLVYAAAINIFTAPNNIAPGGLTGIATMFNFLFGLPIGTMILVMNVPLFILGFIYFGWKFIIKTIIATALSSVVIDTTAGFFPAYHGEPLITVVFGGLLSGVGLALILMRGGTSGGTELAANLIALKFPHISIGKLILVLDVIVVLFSAWVYKDFESPLYAMIVIFITSWIIDAILYGTSVGAGKMMFIVSPKNKEIASAIITRLARGVTALKSRGVYSNKEGEILLCAVRRQEVYRIYHLIHEIDPNAFIIVGDAGEISGEGFRNIAASEMTRKKREKKNK